MQSRLRELLDKRALQNIFLTLALLFVLIFFYTEWQGLQSLWAFLRGALASLPDFLTGITRYFQDVPGAQLRASLLVGGLFGGLTTLIVYLTQLRRAEPQRNPGRSLFFALAGAGVGAIGAQLLLYPTQHCTYAADAPAAQFRLGIALTVVSTLFFLVPLWTWMQREESLTRRRAESSAGYFRGIGLPYLLLLPSLLMLGLFLYYPASQILTLSTRKKLSFLPQEQFVCLENYTSVLNDTIYKSSFYTSVIITVLIVLFSLVLSLGVAVLASQKVRGAGIYRTLLVWPYAISPVVTGVIFLSLFREGGSGIFNYVLDRAFDVQPAWTTDRYLAPAIVIAASVWNILGFNILFYIAGLQNIPPDLLEAAALDGANRVQRFFRVSFPLLAPFTFFLLVTNITFSFYGIYGVIDTLTQGGPPLGPAGSQGGATNVLIYKLYEDAFTPGSPAGFAAAQALVLFLIVGTITLLQFRLVERRITYGA